MRALAPLCVVAAASAALTVQPLGRAAHRPSCRRAAAPLALGSALVSAPAEHCVLDYGGGDGGGHGGRGGHGGGGGGGDDGESCEEFLRLLNSAEQATVLADWTARCRIYGLTDNAELKAAHIELLGQLEEAMHFDTSESGPRGRRMLLGLFKDDEVRALSAAEVSHASGLVVSSMLPYPAELNDPDSTCALRMVHALHLLADAIETPLDITQLRNSPSWLEQLELRVDDE